LTPLQTLLVKDRLEIGPLCMSSGILIAFMAIAAGLDEIFDDIYSIIFVHG
jgi:hypothetical protein